jgi:hypothetical protein
MRYFKVYDSYGFIPVSPSLAGKGIRGLGFALLLCLAMLGCSDPTETQDLMLLGEPLSLVRGESVSVAVTAPTKFFDRNIDEEVASPGGLVLRSFYRSSSTSGLALLVSSADTEIGRHELVLEMGGGRGTLVVSVLGGPVGQGEVFAANAEASAGADWATLYLDGVGTAWDSGVRVWAEGAPGFHVLAWRVVTESRLEVSYGIDLSQEPGIADIVIQDGGARWSVPFSIVAARSFENLAGPQPVVKGRVSNVTLRNPSSGITQWTRLFSETDELELGEAEELQAGTVEIPVRAPFEFPGDSLSLLAKTFSADRRYVEVMPVELELHESGAIVFTPSRVSFGQPSEQGKLTSIGVDLLGFEGLELPSDSGLAVEKVRVESSSSATVDWLVSPVAVESFVTGTLKASGVEWPVAVALTSNETWDAAAAVPVMHAGDRMLVPILTTGLDLVGEAFTLEAPDTLTIHSFEVIDEGCLLAEVSVADTAWSGEHAFWIRNNIFDLRVSINVEEGPFGAL